MSEEQAGASKSRTLAVGGAVAIAIAAITVLTGPAPDITDWIISGVIAVAGLVLILVGVIRWAFDRR